MRIGIANDHRGADCKKLVKDVLIRNNQKVVDYGVNDTRVDYSDIAYRAAFAVTCNEIDGAILIGSIGSEMALAANKVDGIRAAACFDELQASLVREQLDCNVLCLSCELTSDTLLTKIVQVWLKTKPRQGRYKRRLSKIEAVERALHQSKI